MSTIAFIGCDGSGKTSIIERLQADFPGLIKKVYMGLNLESSNYSLPTSRLALRYKLFVIRKRAEKIGNTEPVFLSTHHILHRKQKRNGFVIIIRTVNRLFEAWYRQLISWFYQAQGYLVTYDRHFLFDTAPDPSAQTRKHLAERTYRWLLKYTFPQNDLIIFLDAAPEVLLNRQQEVPVEYMTSQRAAYFAQGKRTANFVTVDAAQPFDQVYADVVQLIKQLYTKHPGNAKRFVIF